MNISEFSLKRPVFATVLNLLIILFGVVGYTFLAVRDYPAIDPAIISINTSYTGANPDIMESQVTEPLEKQINGIPGIKTITSSSTLGNSNITVEFELGVDLEAAASDVRDKVGQASRQLPQDIDAPPVVTKSDANSDFILILAVQSRTKGLLELSDYAENVLQQLEARRQQQYTSPYHFAIVHAALKNYDEAFHFLEQALNDRAEWIPHSVVDFRIRELHQHPKFLSIVERAGI